MKTKITFDDCVRKTLDEKPETALDVLKVTCKLTEKEHWKRNGVDRMDIYFRVCTILKYDCRDLSGEK